MTAGHTLRHRAVFRVWIGGLVSSADRPPGLPPGQRTLQIPASQRAEWPIGSCFQKELCLITLLPVSVVFINWSHCIVIICSGVRLSTRLWGPWGI